MYHVYILLNILKPSHDLRKMNSCILVQRFGSRGDEGFGNLDCRTFKWNLRHPSDAADGAPCHGGTCTSSTDCPVVTSGASDHTETSPSDSGRVKRLRTSRMGSASTCLGYAFYQWKNTLMLLCGCFNDILGKMDGIFELIREWLLIQVQHSLEWTYFLLLSQAEIDT